MLILPTFDEYHTSADFPTTIHTLFVQVFESSICVYFHLVDVQLRGDFDGVWYLEWSIIFPFLIDSDIKLDILVHIKFVFFPFAISI